MRAAESATHPEAGREPDPLALTGKRPPEGAIGQQPPEGATPQRQLGTAALRLASAERKQVQTIRRLLALQADLKDLEAQACLEADEVVWWDRRVHDLAGGNLAA